METRIRLPLSLGPRAWRVLAVCPLPQPPLPARHPDRFEKFVKYIVGHAVALKIWFDAWHRQVIMIQKT